MRIIPVLSRKFPGAAAVTLFALILLLAGCGGEPAGEAAVPSEVAARRADRGDVTLRLAHPDWSSETASANLFKAVLQRRLGYQVELETVPVEEMWRLVAEGEADILTGAWLPTTHRGYYEEYGESLEDLGPNLTGARIGLMVPTVTPGRQTGASGQQGRELVTITTIPEMRDTADRFDGEIVGIESGAGVVSRTREAMEAYDLSGLYNLLETNEERMVNRVGQAIRREEWIVATGWKPHWVFELYNLRFLEDPRGIFGGEESIHTMVREGLQEDASDAHAVLSRISYDPQDLERLMRWIEEDETSEPYQQAVRWIEEHPERVDRWVEGIE
jgi:glycine betaine/proline transport system substrate-binding protein